MLEGRVHSHVIISRVRPQQPMGSIKTHQKTAVLVMDGRYITGPKLHSVSECVCVCVCVCARTRVCVCMCVQEREREIEQSSGHLYVREVTSATNLCCGRGMDALES